MIGVEAQAIDDGRLLVNVEFVSILRAAGLDTFEKIMAHPGGTVIRSVPGRSTVRIELRQNSGASQVVFLKRYEREYLTFGKKLLRFLRWPGADDEALREWRKIFRLRHYGFDTAQPIAVGQVRSGGVVERSFLMTAEIRNGSPADAYFAKHLCGGDARRKWRWLTEAGVWARRFQQAQFIHKDFYLVHVFIVEEGDAWRFHLIDLQRMRGPHWHLPRWYIKDLIAFGFSARAKAGCSRTDLLRLYKAYARKKALLPSDKARIARLWRQIQRLEQRRPKYQRIWNAPSESPAE
jgi:lipopolysaccharide core heptose(I) kinase